MSTNEQKNPIDEKSIVHGGCNDNACSRHEGILQESPRKEKRALCRTHEMQNNIDRDQRKKNNTYREIRRVHFEGREPHVQSLGQAKEAVAVELASARGVVLEVLGEDIHAAREDHQVCHLHKHVGYLKMLERRTKTKSGGSEADLRGVSNRVCFATKTIPRAHCRFNN